jgi:hypothetical protein
LPPENKDLCSYYLELPVSNELSKNKYEFIFIYFVLKMSAFYYNLKVARYKCAVMIHLLIRYAKKHVSQLEIHNQRPQQLKMKPNSLKLARLLV